MKSQKVTVIVNDIESNGIISLEDNVIHIDMGITNQVIDFRDIGVYDKKDKSTLGLILNNNKSIDLILKDYLLLYKIIDDFKKEQSTTKKGNGIKCPECGIINNTNSNECSNCGFPLKNKIKKKNQINKEVINVVVVMVIAILLVGGVVYYLNSNDKYSSNDINQSNNDNVSDSSKTNNDDSNKSKSSNGSDFEETIKHRKEAKTVFSSVNEYIQDYILLGYKNKNYRCTKLLGEGECYEIDYKKDGYNVNLSYEFDSDIIEFDCIESQIYLTCYMDDGVTVYDQYEREE